MIGVLLGEYACTVILGKAKPKTRTSPQAHQHNSMNQHPDWMYDLYQNSLKRESPLVDQEFLKKPIAERELCQQNFRFNENPYLWWLEDRGLI